ncbi:MAG: polyphosphate polymerase domain-containing protein [Lachnospiraceae bacterium]|nr:polyphosphate polymerase domain-containing protein [Lachnospiraceae bacterium]
MLSVYRNEMKYWMSYEDALSLQGELQKLLELDQYSQNGAYRVRSLYFDTINNRDFTEKLDGVEKRRKIRLRIYDETADRAKFEIKEKNGNYQHKTSLWVTREEAKAIMEGDYGILLEHEEEAAARLYTMLTLGMYSPVALIEYDRLAFMYSEYNTRITFDSRVRSSELELDLFSGDINWMPVIDGQVILEVKFNQVLIEPIKKVLEKYHLVNVSVSKYGNGRPLMQKYI